MIGVLFVLMVFAVLCFYQVPPLMKKKYWKELAVFSFLTALALVFSIMHAMHIKLPNPNDPVRAFIHMLGGNM